MNTGRCVKSAIVILAEWRSQKNKITCGQHSNIARGYSFGNVLTTTVASSPSKTT